MHYNNFFSPCLKLLKNKIEMRWLFFYFLNIEKFAYSSSRQEGLKKGKTRF